MWRRRKKQARTHKKATGAKLVSIMVAQEARLGFIIVTTEHTKIHIGSNINQAWSHNSSNRIKAWINNGSNRSQARIKKSSNKGQDMIHNGSNTD